MESQLPVTVMLSSDVSGTYTCACDVMSLLKGTVLIGGSPIVPQVNLCGVQYGHSRVDGDNTAPHLGQIHP